MGDGTTSVVVLAEELLQVVEAHCKEHTSHDNHRWIQDGRLQCKGALKSLHALYKFKLNNNTTYTAPYQAPQESTSPFKVNAQDFVL